ncbi:hypothetical protein P4V43_07080 [Brevibacillus fortis]|uniref:Uncharacterized protein n=1 Tax=Brevibacillus fortis TaxID=2126352 RepID=A0A2P7UML4_9BACL|nr:hypothetical protein [Brevibacillus fortis]MED1781589.1 hypothetical protein [Brevibacillus fortis]PSJ88221.1 hypothetical protein C7R93_24990 [Brevibacillus fortis]
MDIQVERIQVKKGLYLTGIASLVILAIFIYQAVTGMELDTGEILSVYISLSAFLKLVHDYRKLSHLRAQQL